MQASDRLCTVSSTVDLEGVLRLCYSWAISSISLYMNINSISKQTQTKPVIFCSLQRLLQWNEETLFSHSPTMFVFLSNVINPIKFKKSQINQGCLNSNGPWANQGIVWERRIRSIESNKSKIDGLTNLITDLVLKTLK